MPATMTNNVVQYGFRDDDDEDSSVDCGKGRRASSLFGGLRSSTNHKTGGGNNNGKRRGSGKLTGMGMLGMKSANDPYGSNSNSRDNSDGDSDDGSVSSKASVAEMASKTLKKLGGKLKMPKALKKKREASEEDDSSSSEESLTDDEDDTPQVEGQEEDSESSSDDETTDDESSGDDDRSVAQKLKGLTKGIGKALKVTTKIGGGRNKNNKEYNLDDHSLSEDEYDELFDAAFQPAAPEPNIRSRSTESGERRGSKSAFSMRRMSKENMDNKAAGGSPTQNQKAKDKHSTIRRSQSAGVEAVRNNLFRRSKTTDGASSPKPTKAKASRRPSDIPPPTSSKTTSSSRRQREEEEAARKSSRRTNTRRPSKSKTQLRQEQDGHVSDLSDEDSIGGDPHCGGFNPAGLYGGGNAPVPGGVPGLGGAQAPSGNPMDWSMNVTEEMYASFRLDDNDDTNKNALRSSTGSAPKGLLAAPKQKIRA